MANKSLSVVFSCDSQGKDTITQYESTEYLEKISSRKQPLLFCLVDIRKLVSAEMLFLGP